MAYHAVFYVVATRSVHSAIMHCLWVCNHPLFVGLVPCSMNARALYLFVQEGFACWHPAIQVGVSGMRWHRWRPAPAPYGVVI